MDKQDVRERLALRELDELSIELKDLLYRLMVCAGDPDAQLIDTCVEAAVGCIAHAEAAAHELRLGE